MTLPISWEQLHDCHCSCHIPMRPGIYYTYSKGCCLSAFYFLHKKLGIHVYSIMPLYCREVSLSFTNAYALRDIRTKSLFFLVHFFSFSICLDHTMFSPGLCKTSLWPFDLLIPILSLSFLLFFILVFPSRRAISIRCSSHNVLTFKTNRRRLDICSRFEGMFGGIQLLFESSFAAKALLRV